MKSIKYVMAIAGAALLLGATGLQAQGTGATRTSRFWFTHAETNDANCVTLLRAFQALSSNVVDLGFIVLPVTFENADNVLDAQDILIEALGFYYRSQGKTGESGGTQNSKISGSKVCKARKQLAVELIAAIANVTLLSADPAAQGFQADLIAAATAVAATSDTTAMKNMTALLKAFNNSGVGNNFPVGVECDTQAKRALKNLSRDATTQDTCPGMNNTCGAAAAVSFAGSGDPFANAEFRQSVDLSKYTDNIPSPICDVGGRDALWKVTPPVGASNRVFTAHTDNSNFDTMISIWSGPCDALTQLSCTNGVIGVGGEDLSFVTDGTNTFYIVVEGASGQYGRLKLRVTSP